MTTPPPDAGQPSINERRLALAVVFLLERMKQNTRDWTRQERADLTMLTDDVLEIASAQSAPLALPCEATDALNQISAQMPTSEMNEDQIKHADFRYAYDEMIRIARSGLRVALAPPREMTESDIEAAALALWKDEQCKWVSPDYSQHQAALRNYARVVLSAALNAPARVDDDWRPIETAPRDGTYILGYGKHVMREYYIAVVHTYCGIWTIKWMDGYDEPTHWMPLPEPPAQHTPDALSEMRDIRGGEVDEITRPPEEQAALERAMGDVGERDALPQHPIDVVDELLRPVLGSLPATQMAVTIFHALRKQGTLIEVPVDAAPDENSLPMEMLPKDTDSWVLERSDNFHPNGSYEVRIYVGDSRLQIEGIGATPRAAMIAAIEAARERGDV